MRAVKKKLMLCPRCLSPNISYDEEWIRRINPNTNEIIFNEQTPDSIAESPIWNACHNCDFNFGKAEQGEGIVDSNNNIIVEKESSTRDIMIQKLYPTFHTFEKDLREYIEDKMSQEYGTDWKQYHEKEFENARRLVVNIEQKNGTQINENDVLHYTTFQVCITIMTKKRVWNQVFSPYFESRNNLLTHLEELREIRNKLMHRNDDLTNDEINIMNLNIKKIRKNMT